MLRLCIVIVAVLAASAASGAARPLRVGILPYLSPRTLLVEFSPLRQFLEHELRTPVEIHTAPDFPRFLQRTKARDFDLVVTAPHFARLAQKRYGFRPLIAIRADFYALILVQASDPARSLADLKGRKLHLPHRISYVSMQLERFLRQGGLSPEKEMKLKYHSTDNNAILAGQNGQGEAVGTSRAVFERMPKEITERLRIIGSTPSAVSLIGMADPRMPTQRVEAVMEALRKFLYSEWGLDFFEKGAVYFVPANAETMQQTDPYLKELLQRLGEKE